MKQEEGKTSRGKIVAEALEQAIIIFLSAVVALWLTNLSENIKIKDQTKKVLYESAREMERVIRNVATGATDEDSFVGMLYTTLNYDRTLDMRDFMYNESIFINLDPILASGITRFEANYERAFNRLKYLLDNPDEIESWNDIFTTAEDLVINAHVLVGSIRQQAAYLDGRKKMDSTSLYDEDMIPAETMERIDIIIDYIHEIVYSK